MNAGTADELQRFVSSALLLYPDVAVTVKGQRTGGGGDAYLAYEMSVWQYQPGRSPPSLGAYNESKRDYWSACNLVQPFTSYSLPSSTVANVLHGLSLSLLYTAIHRRSSYTRGLGDRAWRNETSPSIAATTSALPPLYFPSSSPSDVQIGGVSAMLALPSLLLLPMFAERILYEREEQLYAMMRIAGLRTAAYWLANYAFDSTISWLWCGSLLIVGYAAGAPMFSEVNLFLWLLLYVVWIHAQLGVSWFLIVFFKRRRVASVFMYLLVIVCSALAFAWGAFLYKRVSWSWWLNFIPQLNFIRALCYLIRYQPTVAQALAVGSEFANALNATLWVASIMMAVAVISHSLHYMTWEQLWSVIPCYRRRVWEGATGQQRLSAALLPVQSAESDAADEDVEQERQRVIDQQTDGRAPAIAIMNLRKQYARSGWRQQVWTRLSSLWTSREARAGKEAKVVNAVQGLYLGMEYGECFGLLGPNGAGQRYAAQPVVCIHLLFQCPLDFVSTFPL